MNALSHTAGKADDVFVVLCSFWFLSEVYTTHASSFITYYNNCEGSCFNTCSVSVMTKLLQVQGYNGMNFMNGV